MTRARAPSSHTQAISALGVPYVLFFIPKTKAGGGGGVTALDRNGDAVTVEGWLKDHGFDGLYMGAPASAWCDAITH